MPQFWILLNKCPRDHTPEYIQGPSSLFYCGHVVLVARVFLHTWSGGSRSHARSCTNVHTLPACVQGCLRDKSRNVNCVKGYVCLKFTAFCQIVFAEVVLICRPFSKAPGLLAGSLVYQTRAHVKGFVSLCSHLIRNRCCLCALIHLSFIVCEYLGQPYFLSSECLLISVVNVSIGFSLKRGFIGEPRVSGKRSFRDRNSAESAPRVPF